MCGLVGSINRLVAYDKSAYSAYFQQALYADTLRGFDSTGMFLMEEVDAKPIVYKKALAAPDFLQLSKVEKFLGKYSNDWDIMIGHNRAATKGGVKDSTAHPFQIGTITMAHNGTIYNHKSLKGGEKFDVDSEAICNSIDVDGIADTIEQIDGAFAIIYHDSYEGSLNIIRNNERPLTIGFVGPNKNDIEGILIASEVLMMRWIASRCKLNIVDAYTPAAGELLTWNIDASNKDWISNISKAKLELKKPKVQVGNVPTAVAITKPTSPSASQGNNAAVVYSNGFVPSQPLTPSTKINTPNLTSTLKKLGLEIGEFVCGIYEGVSHSYNGSRVTLFLDPVDLEEADGPVQIKVGGVDNGFLSVLEKGEVIEGAVIDAYEAFQNGEFVYTIRLDPETLQVVDLNADPDEELIQLLEEEGNEVSTMFDPLEDMDVESDSIPGPGGTTINQKRFDELVFNGCAMCAGDITVADSGKLGWTFNSDPICPSCMESGQAEYFYPLMA